MLATASNAFISARTALWRVVVCALSALALALALALSLALMPLTALAAGGACYPAKGSNDDLGVSISENADAAIADTSGFGISQFSRMNKGTNKEFQGAYYGYRYPMEAENAFAAIVSKDVTLVYVPQSTVDALGIALDDSAFQRLFLATLEDVDKAASNGGPTLLKQSREYLFTSATEVVRGDLTYRFAFELEADHYYASVAKKESNSASDAALYASTGLILPRDEVVIVEQATGFAWLSKFFSELDWSPLWVSLRTTGVAIIVIFILGLLAAWGTIRVSDRMKGLLDTVFTIPMVLPPTVCGFLLLLLFGNSSALGRWMIDHGMGLVFTWPAAVIACIVVGFPMMYRTARGAFESLDPSMLDAARTLGWSEKRVFARLMLPLAWPTIASGTVLAFARAMGEFGATLFFAGNYVGVTQTIPIAIYFDWMSGKSDVAIFWVIVVILISFLVILFINVYSSHTQKYRRGFAIDARKPKHKANLFGDRDVRAMAVEAGEE